MEIEDSGLDSRESRPPEFYHLACLFYRGGFRRSGTQPLRYGCRLVLGEIRPFLPALASSGVIGDLIKGSPRRSFFKSVVVFVMDVRWWLRVMDIVVVVCSFVE